ncbi:MAG: hypothetical protein KQH63_19375 [Desulfobulbaceae bacterium]|nr:hypothetical protein [Desulfobulbaceae bacterium]
MHGLKEDLAGRKTGFVSEIKVGEDLFPYSLASVIEVVLLDPDTMDLAFRSRSNPEDKLGKIRKWQLGTSAEVMAFQKTG